MFILVDNKLVKLSNEQLFDAYMERQRIELESKASDMLHNYLSQPEHWDETVPNHVAVYASWHIDYICDRIASLFMQLRDDDVPDSVAWEKAIKSVLAQRRDEILALPATRENNKWHLRSFDDLMHLLWRSRITMDTATFCLNQFVGDNPALVYEVSYVEQDGCYYIQLKGKQSFYSRMLDNGVKKCRYSELYREILEFLQDEMRVFGKKFENLLWVNE